MTTPRTQRLLDRTAGRLYLASLGWWLHRSWLAAAAICLLLLLCSRLMGLIPAAPLLQWLWVGGVVAIAAAFVVARKPAVKDTARIVDERTGSKELFLTTALLGTSTAEFQPIVLEQAEERAERLNPRDIAPFPWQTGVRNAAIATALVAIAALWLPQLDPFKKEEERNKVAKQEDQLRQTKKATVLRAEQLKQDDAKENDRVEKALAALQKTFKEAKPQEREANLKRLSEHQKEIGEMWRQAANQKRNDALDQAAQKFGQVNPQQTQQWREDLKKGDASALKREMEAVKEELKKLAGQPDSAEKRQQQEQLAQRISQMAEGLKQTASSPQLQAALQRAMEQLDMSKMSEMSKEALQAAAESMSLSQQELEQLAQMMNDQQALEDALKNLQMAKQLAGQCQLDGEACKNCQGMGDYASLYQRLLNNQTGPGPGMGPNPGQGAGGKAPENDEAETEFKQERSPTQLTAGKTLLQWKNKEIGPTGARAEDYKEAVRQVKQGVSEAITAEQVPPGYHTAIQKYFDALPEK
jgi:DNA repair exonuclease SbcCD ATPase subunit